MSVVVMEVVLAGGTVDGANCLENGRGRKPTSFESNVTRIACRTGYTSLDPAFREFHEVHQVPPPFFGCGRSLKDARIQSCRGDNLVY